jgi:hypothetical protein
MPERFKFLTFRGGMEKSKRILYFVDIWIQWD